MIVKVRVILNADSAEIISRIGSVIRVTVQNNNYDGKTNKVIRNLLANFFGVGVNKVSLRKGTKGKEKTIEIEGKPEHELKQILETIP